MTFIPQQHFCCNVILEIHDGIATFDVTSRARLQTEGCAAMEPPEWPYPEAQPVFQEPGDFNAWIGGTKKDDRSAAAWRVECKSEPSIFRQQAKPSGPGSTDQRAMLGALAGVLESLQSGSTVDCYTRSQYAIRAGCDADQWKARGWKGAEQALANPEILVRIVRVMDTRRIILRMHHVPKGRRGPHDNIITKLNELARSKMQGDSV
ncbi:RNase H family protein [Mesorhizobium sp. URHB0026]